MAIGSEPPIGEKFGSVRKPDGTFDWDAYTKWAEWFGRRVKEDGLMFDYAKVIYPKKNK